MQLESGLKSAPDYLATLLQKMKSDRASYDTTWSLAKLSLTSYSDSGQRQYPNIYQRGAIVAGLLDIKLLELSHGEHGLRDLIQNLSQQYGKKRAFPDDSLFAIIAARTDPAIGDFINRYVRDAQHLPVKEYYAKLGITLVEDEKGFCHGALRHRSESHSRTAEAAHRVARQAGQIGELAKRGVP